MFLLCCCGLASLGVVSCAVYLKGVHGCTDAQWAVGSANSTTCTMHSSIFIDYNHRLTRKSIHWMAVVVFCIQLNYCIYHFYQEVFKPMASSNQSAWNLLAIYLFCISTAAYMIGGSVKY